MPELMTYMAGAIAEEIILGQSRGSDDDDRDEIEKMAESSNADFATGEWQRLEPRMRHHTQQLVRRHRAAIQRVADALKKHKRLTAARIDKLCRSTVVYKESVELLGGGEPVARRLAARHFTQTQQCLHCGLDVVGYFESCDEVSGNFVQVRGQEVIELASAMILIAVQEQTSTEVEVGP